MITHQLDWIPEVVGDSTQVQHNLILAERERKEKESK
jgi:hypothetical protein